MQFEVDIIKALQKASNGFSDAVFLGITQLGTELLFLAVAVVLYWCIDKRYAYRFFNVYILGVAVNNFIKLGFKRARPFDAHPDEIHSIGEPETTYSFPSGHTNSIACVSAMLTGKYGKRHPTVPVVCALATVLVMLSRMYLGQHYLSDVFCGLTVGVLCAVAFNGLLSLFGEREELFIIPNVALTATLVAVLAGTGLINSPSGADILKGAGAFFAFGIGYYIEKRYVRFDVAHRRDALNLAFRLAVGLAVTVGLQQGLKYVFPKDISMLYCFTRYFIMAAWASLGAPALFKLVNDRLDIKKFEDGIADGSAVFEINSEKLMLELGKALARTLSGGDVVLISGELGAGKTVLCKGIARGLNVSAPVVSPTFTLMNEYYGDKKFCHFDAYRLTDSDEAAGAGLSDYFGDPLCVCAVEWWENITDMFDGLNTVKVTVEKTGDATRKVTVQR